MTPRRRDLRFEVGGIGCAAWLHLPPGEGPHPAVVMLHSTAGVRQMRCYADRGDEFARAGLATLNFDCRGFGASGGEPRQLFDVRRQAEDLEAAVGLARSLPEVDGARLALWGGSASCAPVLQLASRRPDLRAVVCLTPFVPGRATQCSARTPFARLALAALADSGRMALRRPPRGVRVGGEPSDPAILVRDGAAQGERALLPEDAVVEPGGERARLPGGGAWENRVVLRPRLRTPHPLRLAAKVEAPLLVVAGERDDLCPPGPATKLARRAPRGALELFPAGHFELYEGRSTEAEAAFLSARAAR